ncbi:MAG: hypothetical protein HY303_10305 [Candidatus Wallbacteria bacterium]|nr:hypothetical protein [Candidatus Wallbacteria bacterium]
MNSSQPQSVWSVCILARAAVLGAFLAALAGPAAAASNGLDVSVGSKLIFAAYGDTRPSFYPFGDQAKHLALTKAIQQFDSRNAGELDLVLVTGDLIFADVPGTDRDWKPAWEALANMRSGSHPLYVYPALGNHELLGLSDNTGDPDTDKLIRALWQWGGSSVSIQAERPLEPMVLAQMTHLSQLYPLLSRQLPSDLTEFDLRVLWIQLASDAVGRLPEPDRQALEKARRDARMQLRLALVKGTRVDVLARNLASGQPRTILETLHAVDEAAKAANPSSPLALLARDAMARLGDPATPEFKLLARALQPTLSHLKALQALTFQTSGEEHERRWLQEVSAAPDKAAVKSWGTFREHLLKKLGSYLQDTTSLAGQPTLTPGWTGPTWYYTDRLIPGGGGKAVRFIAANSNLSTIVSTPNTPAALDQEAFLVEAIRSAGGPVVLFDHHPPVSIGSHGGSFNPMTDLISAFREMLYKRVFPKLSAEEQKRIWTIITGHDHDYERMVDRTRGTALLVSGGGGVPLKTKRLPPDQIGAYLTRAGQIMGATLDSHPIWYKPYNFIACEVTPGKMEFRVYGLCEPGSHTMDDPDFQRQLPSAIDAELADDSKLIDHFTIQEDAAGTRTVTDASAAGCQ